MAGLGDLVVAEGHGRRAPWGLSAGICPPMMHRAAAPRWPRPVAFPHGTQRPYGPRRSQPRRDPGPQGPRPRRRRRGRGRRHPRPQARRRGRRDDLRVRRDHPRGAGGPRGRGDGPARRQAGSRHHGRAPVGARQPARAVHLAVRAPRGARRPGPDRADRLHPRQQPARARPRVPRRRPQARPPDVRSRSRPHDRGHPRARGRFAGDPGDRHGARCPGPGPRGGVLRVRVRGPAGDLRGVDPLLAQGRPGPRSWPGPRRARTPGR